MLKSIKARDKSGLQQVQRVVLFQGPKSTLITDVLRKTTNSQVSERRENVAILNREDQQDSTIKFFIINFCLNMFRASLYPSSGDQKPCYCI